MSLVWCWSAFSLVRTSTLQCARVNSQCSGASRWYAPVTLSTNWVSVVSSDFSEKGRIADMSGNQNIKAWFRYGSRTSTNFSKQVEPRFCRFLSV